MNNKVIQILNEEFDDRMGLAVIQYLYEQVGADNAREITDDEIDAIDGNAFMTKRFCQAMVKCARRIATECSFTKDVIPYLIDNYSHLSGHISQRRTKEILLAYIDNDLDSAEPGYVRDTLVNTIGVDDKELKDLDLYDWLGFDTEEGDCVYEA